MSDTCNTGGCKSFVDLTEEACTTQDRPCIPTTPFFVKWCSSKAPYPRGSIVYDKCGFYYAPKRESGSPRAENTSWIPFSVSVLFDMLLSKNDCSFNFMKGDAEGCRLPAMKDEIRCWDCGLSCSLEDDNASAPKFEEDGVTPHADSKWTICLTPTEIIKRVLAGDNVIQTFENKGDRYEITDLKGNVFQAPIAPDIFPVSYEHRDVDGGTETYVILSNGAEHLVHNHGDDKFVTLFEDIAGNTQAIMTDGTIVPVPITHTVDVTIMTVARNADNGITMTATNGTVFTIPPALVTVPDSVEVTDFTQSGSDLIITESNGDTHTLTLPSAGADIFTSAKTHDPVTGLLTTTLTDGSTISTTLSIEKYVTSYENRSDRAIFYDGVDSYRRTHFNDGSLIDHNESYLLQKRWVPDYKVDKLTTTADHAAGPWDVYATMTWTNADLVALGMRPTDNCVDLHLAASVLISTDSAHNAQSFAGFIINGMWQDRFKVNTLKTTSDDSDNIIVVTGFPVDMAGGISVDLTAFVRDMQADTSAQCTWKVGVKGSSRAVLS